MSASRTPSDHEPVPAPSLEASKIRAPIDLMHLSALLEQFMAARTPDEGRQLLEQHPELLSDDAAWVLESALDGARAEGNARAVFVIHERRGLLQRCRELGVAAGFAGVGG